MLFNFNNPYEIDNFVRILTERVLSCVNKKCCPSTSNGSFFVDETESVVLLGNGSSSNHLRAIVKISEEEGNTLIINSDGLFAPGGGGSGSLTEFSADDLLGLFTTNVDNPTTIPNLTFDLNVQSANKVFAGPVTGIAVKPSFRTLSSFDIPDLSNSYFKQGGNSFGAIGILGLNDGFPLEIKSGSTISLKPGLQGKIILNSPTGYISQEWYNSSFTKLGEIGLASLGGGIDEFYIKPFNTAEISLYDKIRLINIPQDDTTTKLISIDSNDRLRWHNSTSFAPAIGGGNYIQNTFVGPQTSANWWISGHGRVNDYLQIHNAARLTTDSTAKLAVTTATDSTFGDDLRVRVLRFWDFSIQNDASSSNSLIYSQQGNFLNLKADLNIVLDAPNLALNQATIIDAGSFHSAFVIRGSQGSVGDFDYFGLYNHNTAGDSKSTKAKITFNHDRTTGGKTIFGKIGSEVIDYSNTLYKGDLVFETTDATINAGVPVEYFRIKHDGKLYAKSLDTDSIAPVTTGTIKMMICDVLGLISFIDIPSGGGASGTVTSVAISSTDLDVTNSPITNSGTFILNVKNDAITFAKMQNIGVGLIGNDSGTSDPKLITIDSTLQIVAGVLGVTAAGGGTPTLQQVITSGATLTGNNTINAGGFNFTLNNNAIITLGTSAAQIILDHTGQDITLISTDKAFFKLATFGSATPGDVLSIVNTTTGEVAWVANGVGAGGSVTSFSAGNLSPLFTSNVATATSTPALTFILSNAAAHTWFGNATAGSTTPLFNSNAAFVRVNDTNLIATLSGNPTTALLETMTMTLSWNGELAPIRGGTGLNAIGTAGQLLRTNLAATALEYFTAPYLLSLNGLTTSAQLFAWDAAGGDFSISSSINTHTFHLPDATSTVRGVVAVGLQTFGGPKIITEGLTVNSTGANSDTRIAGDNETNLLFLKASNDRIGMFTNTPVSPVHISKGTNTFSGIDIPMVFIDSGGTTPTTMELKGSQFISGLLITNTGPSNIPYMALYNEGNEMAWAETIEVDNSFHIKEGFVLEGTSRIIIEPLGGTISFFGNITLENKINQYNNTAITNGQLLIGHTVNGTFEKAVLTQASANQVIIANGAGTITLSLPQNIHTTASPQFLNMGLGIAAVAGVGLYVGGSLVSNGIYVGSTFTPLANNDSHGIYIQPIINEASSGNHSLFASLRLDGPSVVANTATITRTAALYISGPSSAVVSDDNYSVYIAGGPFKTLSTIFQQNASSYSIGGYDILVRNQTTGRYEALADDIQFSAQTVSYTLVLADKSKMIKINNAAANTLTVPPNASVAFSVGTTILVVQEGAGQITITPGAGVTLNSAGALLKTRLQFSQATLIKTATNVWLVSGDLA